MDQMDKIRSCLSILERDNQIILDELYAVQKELEGILEGKEAGAGGEISKAEIIDAPEENVMTNPVILSKILSHLELSTLFGLRLVCKVWDEVVIALPEFPKRVYLHLPKLFPCCTVAPVPAINPNLTKNIYIKDVNWCKSDNYNVKVHDPAQTTDTAFKNLMTFFCQYHHNVENITLECDWEDHDLFNTHLVTALSTLEFPKLRGIVIKDKFKSLGSYGHVWNWNEDDGISTLDHFETRPNLTSLQLDNTIAGSPFHDVFQKLIISAPNLEEITIRGNFYPDLSTCKNLKIVSYSGIPYYYEDKKCWRQEPSFNLESLSKMLDQVKHSLTKLTLEDSYLDCNWSCNPGDTWDHSQLGRFKFPDVVNKLEVSSIQEYSGKTFFQPELKKLNPIQFPKLKKLFIGVEKCSSFDMYHTGEETLDNVLGGISHSFYTISSLHLNGTLIVSQDIRQRIPILFPNLIKLTMPWSVRKEDEKPDFDSVIDFCSGWKLQELDIGTAMQCDWSAFKEGLGRFRQTQNDIRMLKLRVPTKYTSYFSVEKPMFDLWYDTKKQLEQVGTECLDLQRLSFRPQSDVIRKAIEEAVWKILSEQSLRVFFV